LFACNALTVWQLRRSSVHSSGSAGLSTPPKCLKEQVGGVFRVKDSAGLCPLFTIERQQVEERYETIENNASSQTIYLHTGGNVASEPAICVGVISG